MDENSNRQLTEDSQDEEIRKRVQIELARIYQGVPVGRCYFDTNLRYLHVND